MWDEEQLLAEDNPVYFEGCWREFDSVEDDFDERLCVDCLATLKTEMQADEHAPGR